MNDILEKDVDVDGPVVNEVERSSTSFTTGPGPAPAGRFTGAWAAMDREAEAGGGSSPASRGTRGASVAGTGRRGVSP